MCLCRNCLKLCAGHGGRCTPGVFFSHFILRAGIEQWRTRTCSCYTTQVSLPFVLVDLPTGHLAKPRNCGPIHIHHAVSRYCGWSTCACAFHPREARCDPLRSPRRRQPLMRSRLPEEGDAQRRNRTFGIHFVTHSPQCEWVSDLRQHWFWRRAPKNRITDLLACRATINIYWM